MKILLAGDTHSNIHHFKYLFKVAQENDCSLIIVLGDFMFFPNFNYSIKFLNEISKISLEENIPVWWLDGNHENHDYIDVMTGGITTQSFLTRTENNEWKNIYYLPRGYRFELDGVKFMSYGGAYSVDRPRRVKFASWFPQEIVDLNRVEEISDEPVDILLTHDVPYGYKFSYNEFSNDSLISANSRHALYKLVQKTTPLLCFGGHHHINAQYQVTHRKGVADCFILNCDQTGKESWHIIDTEKIKEML